MSISLTPLRPSESNGQQTGRNGGEMEDIEAQFSCDFDIQPQEIPLAVREFIPQKIGKFSPLIYQEMSTLLVAVKCSDLPERFG